MDYKTDGNFHLDFMELLARRMKPDIYLELGLGPTAECINRISGYCKRSLGVDIKGCRGHKPGWELFHVSTDEFFEKSAPLWLGLNKEVVDLCFIDADHSAEVVWKDLRNVLPYMKQDGIVVLHDTYPESAKYTAPGYSGDCFRVAEEMQEESDLEFYEIVTLPFPPGLSIIRKREKHLLWRD